MPKTELKGTVTSNKMNKTVNVSVDIFKRHAVYGKSMRNTKKFMAHYEDMTLNIGDTVIIQESKPFSKNVKWQVIEKVGDK